jgi:hypothetical protein
MVEKEETGNMIRLGVNKKLLQLHVQQVTGKVITLKDLSNVRTQLNDQATKNDLAAVVEQLQQIKGRD